MTRPVQIRNRVNGFVAASNRATPLPARLNPAVTYNP
jgi:hypothetical protein